MKKQSCAILLAFLLVGWMPSIQKAASREPARARQGMVAATTEIASRVGVELMQHGGNAVDAAVAAAVSLAVSGPRGGDICAGRFMEMPARNRPSEAILLSQRAP